LPDAWAGLIHARLALGELEAARSALSSVPEPFGRGQVFLALEQAVRRLEQAAAAPEVEGLLLRAGVLAQLGSRSAARAELRAAALRHNGEPRLAAALESLER